MAYNVISVVLRRLGFCCKHGYFTAVRHTPTSEVAAELGVHLRTARRWRQACREKGTKCEGLKECCLRKEG